MAVKKETTATSKAVKQTEAQPDVAELMKMMQEMQNQIKSLSEKNQELEKQNLEIKPSGKIINIEPNEFINVMSLVANNLNLSTQGYGQGEKYKFVEFGEVQPIIYSDLSRIISNQKTFLEKQLFVILDDRVNERHQLKKFSDVASKDTLDLIVSLEPRNVDELFSQLSSEQKDNVVSMIVRKSIENKGEDLDFGKLRKMSKHYKRDISELLDDSIEYDENLRNKTEE